MLTHSVSVSFRAIVDMDSACRSGIEVDVLQSGSRATNEAQVWKAIEHVLVDAYSASKNQSLGVGVLRYAKLRVGLAGVDAGHSRPAQALFKQGVHGIEKENFHRLYRHQNSNAEIDDQANDVIGGCDEGTCRERRVNFELI